MEQFKHWRVYWQLEGWTYCKWATRDPLYPFHTQAGFARVYAVFAVCLLAPRLGVGRRLRVRPGLLSDQRSVRAVRGGLIRARMCGLPDQLYLAPRQHFTSGMRVRARLQRRAQRVCGVCEGNLF